jgi:predicted RNA-binding protein
LETLGDGTIRLTGGYTYSSNTDHVGGQYRDLKDGPWIYNIASNTWSGGKLVPADSRVYRTGPFHPDHYFTGHKPDAAKFASWLKKLPANEWVPTNPPHLPRLNGDWGTARIDPSRDMILRWSGGHSAHGGTDVLHFHFSTNRWELPFPVEFPLGQLYSNTSYPNGFNFNSRPWMTGHTYQNYAYDPPSKTMVKAGRPRHFYIYDPDVGDWIGRGRKPAAMQYNSCFYTLTLTATPKGIVCWDKNGKVHRYVHNKAKWVPLELTGDKLPGAYVDNSTIAYDSKRDRVLIVNTLGYGKPFDGQVWSIDLKTNKVTGLSPQGQDQAGRFANIDKCCYDAEHDLLLLGTYLKDVGDHTPTPAYDCAKNEWVTLDLKYTTGQRYGNTTRAFPHRRSDGLMFDARRKLIWGTDMNSQVYVLRLDLRQANVKPLR